MKFPAVAFFASISSCDGFVKGFARHVVSITNFPDIFREASLQIVCILPASTIKIMYLHRYL